MRESKLVQAQYTQWLRIRELEVQLGKRKTVYYVEQQSPKRIRSPQPPVENLTSEPLEEKEDELDFGSGDSSDNTALPDPSNTPSELDSGDSSGSELSRPDVAALPDR